jgi:glycosyltransferase involved in cell wall biosynthesis
MKIIYIANSRLPTEKAHGVQIMNMCEAFSQQGIDVELVVPWRFNKIKEDPFDYYDIKRTFKIKKLPSIDLVRFGKIGFLIQSISFAKCVFWRVLFQKTDVIYSRDELPLFFLSFFKKNIFWEAHQGELNFIVKRLFKKCLGIITISRGLKDFYLKYGANEEKISVVPDGVNLEKFDINISKEEARKKIGLFSNKKIVLYMGHLYGWKGADILTGAASFLGSDNLVVFVGGTEKDVGKFKIKNANLKNIMIVGHRPHQEIPYWLKAADILVLPNSAKEKISQFYTSPMKLFEYMASGTPIVASGLPSIREILNKENAVLVQPDNSASLAAGIEKVLKNSDFSAKISRQAYLDVQNYTWDKRAKNILDFIKSN